MEVLYAFLTEDLIEVPYNSLLYQKEYASRLGKICIGELFSRRIIDLSGKDISIKDCRVFLRCTYDNLYAGIELFDENGAKLVESDRDVNMIESWYYYVQPVRSIKEMTIGHLLSEGYLMNKTDRLFVKSKHKGFSASVRVSKIQERDRELLEFFSVQGERYGDELLVSKWYPIRSDSLGTRESRHFVIDDVVVNSSRQVRSIRHTVPKSHLEKANEIARQLKENFEFPHNYVLDLGEFLEEDGTPHVDIVEINPISCSMCFVNNSVFDEIIPEITESHKNDLYGAEFCYDAIRNPSNYSRIKTIGTNYAMESPEKYSFI